jgi:hypothetical protein
MYLANGLGKLWINALWLMEVLEKLPPWLKKL